MFYVYAKARVGCVDIERTKGSFGKFSKKTLATKRKKYFLEPGRENFKSRESCRQKKDASVTVSCLGTLLLFLESGGVTPMTGHEPPLSPGHAISRSF